MFISMQKINFIAHYFFETLQRYCIVVIFSTLDMPGCTYQIWLYQLFEYFEVYLYKIQLYLLLLSQDTAKIFQTCMNLLKGLFVCMQKINFMPPFFILFNCDWLHARLNSHNEAWSYKKKKHRKSYSIQEICLERTYS